MFFNFIQLHEFSSNTKGMNIEKMYNVYKSENRMPSSGLQCRMKISQYHIRNEIHYLKYTINIFTIIMFVLDKEQFNFHTMSN